jgi:hypothetical protein
VEGYVDRYGRVSVSKRVSVHIGAPMHILTPAQRVAAWSAIPLRQHALEVITTLGEWEGSMRSGRLRLGTGEAERSLSMCPPFLLCIFL